MAARDSVKADNNPHGAVYEEMAAHFHWDGYDMSLEGCRYNILDVLVRATPFDSAAAGAILCEIESLAQSNGYGVEDSYICDVDLRTDEEIEASPELSAKREMHSEDPDAQYTEDTGCSVRLLEETAATPEAQQFTRIISEVIAVARTRGAEMRRANDRHAGQSFKP